MTNKCPTCGSTATIDDGSACAQCGCDRDANERLALTACSPSSDVRQCGEVTISRNGYVEKLERERDKYKAAYEVAIYNLIGVAGYGHPRVKQATDIVDYSENDQVVARREDAPPAE